MATTQTTDDKLYSVSQSLHCTVSGQFSLPQGKTWKDVTDHYVKWDSIHLLIDGVWVEKELNSDSTDGMDWKRPSNYEIHEGEDFNNEIYSSD